MRFAWPGQKLSLHSQEGFRSACDEAQLRELYQKNTYFIQVPDQEDDTVFHDVLLESTQVFSFLASDNPWEIWVTDLRSHEMDVFETSQKMLPVSSSNEQGL